MPSSTTSSDPESAPTRVLLVVDNQPTFTRAASLLTPDCVVVGTASNGKAAPGSGEIAHP